MLFRHNSWVSHRRRLSTLSKTIIEVLESRRLLSVAGVDFSYYQGAWSALPNFSTLTPVKTGLTHNFDLSIRTVDTDYGFVWTGNIATPVAGAYTFYTGSDDGSELLIDGTRIVNNDSTHPYTEVSGNVTLTAGTHAITVEYFQAGGGQQLTVSYAGPGISKEAIPDSVLTGTSPGTVDVGAAPYGAVGDGVTNDSPAIQAAINAAPDGATLELDAGKTYLLKTGLNVARPLNIEGNGATLLLDTSAYPENETVFYNPVVGTAYTFSQTITAGTTTFNDVISTSVLIPGDTVFVQLGTDPNDSTQPNWGEICQVITNTGSAVTVNIAVPYNISQGSLSNSIERITDVPQNMTFQDVNFNYVSGYTPDANLWLNLTRNVTVNNVTGQFTIMANITDSQNVTVTNCNGTLNKLDSSSGRLVSAWQTDGLYITNNTATTAADAPIVFLESWERNTTISGLTINWNDTASSTQDVFHFTGNSYNTSATGIVINNVGAINLVETGSQVAYYSFGTVTVSGPIIAAPLPNVADLVTNEGTFAASTLLTRTFTVQVPASAFNYTVPLCSSVVESMSFTLSNLTGTSSIYCTNSNNAGTQLMKYLVAGQTLVLPQSFGTDYEFNDPNYDTKQLHFYTGSTVPANTTLNVSVTYYLFNPTLTLPAAPANLAYDGTNDVTNWVTPTLTGVSGQPAPTGTTTLTYYSGSSTTGTPLSSPPINAGTYTVIASYGGDQVYTSAVSNAVTFVIKQPLVLSGSAFYLQFDADGQHLDIWNSVVNTGTISQSVLLSAIPSIAINGVSGGAAVTVDFSNGNIVPGGGLTFTGTGNASGNTLTVVGVGGSDTLSAATGSITLNGNAVSYTSVGTVAFKPAGSNEALSITGGAVLLLAGSGAGITTDVFSSINVALGAKLIAPMAASHPTRLFIQTSALTLAGAIGHWTSTLDLNNNDMDVIAGNLINLNDQIKQGYSGGTWQGGGGIISSFAAADSSHLTALGAILDGSTYGTAAGSLGTFDGINPATSDVLLKYTYYGDANLDGQVDGSDYTLIDNGFHNHLTGWSNGDFNDDGMIDGSDYTLIDNSYNMQSMRLAAQIATATARIANISRASAPVFYTQAVTPQNIFSDTTIADQRHRAIDGVGL